MKPARVVAAALAAAIVIGGATATTNAAVIEPVTPISGPLGPNGATSRFEVTADSQHVVYLADQDGTAGSELYAWAMDGSGTVQLNDPSHGSVTTFQIAPNSTHVVYRAMSTMRLYAAPITGGPIVPLGEGFGRADVEYVISPDSAWVAYRADVDPTGSVRLRLFSERLDGTGDPIQLSGTTVNGDVAIPYAISSDSGRVVYRADEDPTTTNVVEIYSSPIDGGGSTKLNHVIDAAIDVRSFATTPDAARVVYLVGDGEDRNVNDTLHSAPIGGGPVVELNGPLVAGGDVRTDFQVTPDSQRVIFDADADAEDTFELYSALVGVAGPRVQLSGEMVGDGDVGCLHHRPCFRISADSSIVVYRADQETNGKWELFSRAPDGSGDNPKVSSPLMPPGGEVWEEFEISPDGQWIVYPEGTTDPNSLLNVYAARLDGTTEHRLLNDPTVSGGGILQDHIAITSDSKRVVFLGDTETDGVVEAFSRPIDGSGVPTKLNGVLGTDGNVTDYQIVPDASAVVYRADQTANEQFELFMATWAVPTAGADTATVTSSASVSIDLTVGDTIAAGALDWDAVTPSLPAHGTAAPGGAPGEVVYTPEAGFFGIDQFSYRVCADGDSTLCDEATVTITVNAPPPVADDDTASVAAGGAVEIDVLDGDAVVAGATLDPGSVAITSPAVHGTAEPGGAPGNIVYTPTAGFSGTDQFTYQVCLVHDGTLCDEGAVTITVDAPPPTTAPPTTAPPTTTKPPVKPPVKPPTKPPVKPPISPKAGYWLLESDGDLRSFGRAPDLPSVEPDLAAGASAVAVAAHPDGNGVWVLTSDGDIVARGSAHDFGRVDLGTLTKPGEMVATMSASPDGAGLWVFTTAGRIISFGTAVPASQMSGASAILGLTLDGPIIDSVATPSGKGAFLVGTDGGVFAVGDARFIDSVRGVLTATIGPPGLPHQPVVGIVPDGDGNGYWNVATDGGVFAFGSPFRGSLPAIISFDQLAAPVNGMVAYGNGYLLVAGDGGVFTFSNLPFAGSAAGSVDSTVVDIAAVS